MKRYVLLALFAVCWFLAFSSSCGDIKPTEHSHSADASEQSVEASAPDVRESVLAPDVQPTESLTTEHQTLDAPTERHAPDVQERADTVMPDAGQPDPATISDRPHQDNAAPEPAPEPASEPAPEPAPEPAMEKLPDSAPDATPENPAMEAVSTDTGVPERSTPPEARTADTGTPDLPPMSALDDDFSGTVLHSSWKIMNPSLFTYSLSGGALHMVPGAYCVWYHRDQGPYIHKSITGNFAMTTVVRARKASNTSQPVGTANAPYQFAGLMLRNPTVSGTNENYIFVVVGHHDPGRGMVIEQKTTTNGSSTVSTTTWPSGDAEVRLCRVNTVYLLYARAIGATTWTQMRRYTRSDLPATLQAGLIGYTYTYRFDMRASFDFVRFHTNITKEADCTQ